MFPSTNVIFEEGVELEHLKLRWTATTSPNQQLVIELPATTRRLTICTDGLSATLKKETSWQLRPPGRVPVEISNEREPDQPSVGAPSLIASPMSPKRPEISPERVPSAPISAAPIRAAISP